MNTRIGPWVRETILENQNICMLFKCRWYQIYLESGPIRVVHLLLAYDLPGWGISFMGGGGG